jgi:hypothetical protein
MRLLGYSKYNVICNMISAELYLDIKNFQGLIFKTILDPYNYFIRLEFKILKNSLIIPVSKFTFETIKLESLPK